MIHFKSLSVNVSRDPLTYFDTSRYETPICKRNACMYEFLLSVTDTLNFEDQQYIPGNYTPAWSYVASGCIFLADGCMKFNILFLCESLCGDINCRALLVNVNFRATLPYRLPYPYIPRELRKQSTLEPLWHVSLLRVITRMC